MRTDINQLKDQMSQILEARAALKSTREAPVAKHEEVTFSYPYIVLVVIDTKQCHSRG